ncbi:MAG: alanine racemase [Bacteroidota bacterium]
MPTRSLPASPLRAEIDLSALRRNVRRLAAHVAPAQLMGIVKADAYGHGAVPVARALADEGLAWFAVARLDEALALRAAEVPGRVLVLGAPHADALNAHALDAYAAHGFDLSITSASVAEAVIAWAASTAREAPLRVHVKADTGMHRLGIAPDAVPGVLARLYATERIEVVGLLTHFATADEAASAFAATQAARFDALLGALERTGVPVPPVFHVANSGAAVLGPPFVAPAGTTALARVGGLVYGVPSSPDLAREAERLGLEPVMRLVAPVVHVQTVAAGESVSYGQTWTASAPTRIATLAVGYGDGLPRALSNVGEATVGGRRFPVAGRVCMDLTMLDLGAPDGPGREVCVGDEAVFFGPDGPSAFEVGERIGTISYELTTGLTGRVPRVVVG